MLKTAITLGVLACVGPLAIDMYLPALPGIALDLGSSVAATQATLTAFFVAFGISQMIYGPWADQVGRKPPLYAGLLIFAVGSLGCFVSPNIEWLTAARFVQGAGAAVVMVIPRAIIRDLYTGIAATRLMAMIMLVIAISPMLAPTAGTLVMLTAGWRMIFLALCVIAVFSLLLTKSVLPETLAPDNKMPVRLRPLLGGLATLLTDRDFMGVTMIGGFGMASFFVFIASASFVYTGEFGLSPLGFSLAFAINAIGFFTASHLAAPLAARLGMASVVRHATAGFFVITTVLMIASWMGYASLVLIVAMLFTANACLGLVIPTTMVMALDGHGDMAGLASSLGGTLQMLAGGIMISLASPFFDGSATPLLSAIAFCGIAAFVISRMVFASQTTQTH